MMDKSKMNFKEKNNYNNFEIKMLCLFSRCILTFLKKKLNITSLYKYKFE